MGALRSLCESLILAAGRVVNSLSASLGVHSFTLTGRRPVEGSGGACGKPSSHCTDVEPGDGPLLHSASSREDISIAAGSVAALCRLVEVSTERPVVHTASKPTHLTRRETTIPGMDPT